MTPLLKWAEPKCELRRNCLDINARTLRAGQDPRSLILAFFGLRWSKDPTWDFHQRIVIDHIFVDGQLYVAGRVKK
jgi:hypothetical protein